MGSHFLAAGVDFLMKKTIFIRFKKIFEKLKKCVLLRRRDGRVVDCGGLENRWGVTAPGGSNPSLSARIKYKAVQEVISWRPSLFLHQNKE
jgi:hypothetical protein